jgi:predicted nucleic acid-binding Zn ribbon protein
MNCLNCGKDIEEWDDDDFDEDDEEERELDDEEFCSPECREEYMAKFYTVAMLNELQGD